MKQNQNYTSLTFILALSLAPIYTHLANAEEPTSRKIKNDKSLSVKWYKPEVRVSEKKGFSKVILTGTTKPGNEIKIATDKIPLIDDKGKVKVIRLQRVTSEPTVKADDRGNFDLKLDLPFLTAQLPLEVKSPNAQAKQYQISLEVRKEDVVMKNQKNLKNSPYARRKWGLWAGFGYNYLSYAQKTPAIESNIEFESFAAPALYTKIVRSLNRDWAFQATYNTSPGKTSSSGEVSVTKDKYNWSFLTGEFTYFNPKWTMQGKKRYNEFGIQFGMQYHNVPFLQRTSTTDQTSTSIEDNDILLGAIGGTWLAHYGRYWMLETYARYQHPIQSGDTFDISPKLAFDGSVGVIYKIRQDLRTGLFWYGQWHQYDFSNATDNFTGSKVSGEQSLLFSDFELRVGWEFD